jgi:hypothetical protein
MVKKETVDEYSLETQNQIMKEFDSSPTSCGLTLLELSKQFKIVGICLKWFGCPFCQEVIESIGNMLVTMLKIGIIPVIIYQENENNAKKYFQETTDLNVGHLIYWKITKNLQNLLGITSASFINHVEAMVKMDVVGLCLGPKKRTLSIPKSVINPLSAFCVLFIEDGVVKKKVVYETLSKRLDFGLFLNEIGSTKSTIQISKMLKYFPNLDWEEEISKLKRKKSVKVKIESKSFDKLEEVLESEIGKFYFKSFLTNQTSVEGYLLYEDVAHFKSELKRGTFSVQEIYKSFLEDASAHACCTVVEFADKFEEKLRKYDERKFSYNDEQEMKCLMSFFDEILVDLKLIVFMGIFNQFTSTFYYEKFKSGNEKSINYLI